MKMKTISRKPLELTKAIEFPEQLAHIMRILLVKRIDAEFYAFKMSLERFYNASKQC
jgi:hypothetical protein